MVRINIINPKLLTDQHLVAEYLETLMLVSYVRKYPEIKDIPDNYCLGKGHIKFFKDKLLYLKKRHELIKKEMKKRGFKTQKTLNLTKIPKKNQKDWKPKTKNFICIKKRLIEKISLKPDYYRYYGKKYPLSFYKKLIS